MTKQIKRAYEHFGLMFAVAINLAAAALSLVIHLQQAAPAFYSALFLGAIVLMILAALCGWHAKRRAIWNMDWSDIQATREANILLGQLSVDLLKNAFNGDLVGVMQRNKIAIGQLKLMDPKHFSSNL